MTPMTIWQFATLRQHGPVSFILVENGPLNGQRVTWQPGRCIVPAEVPYVAEVAA